MEVPVDSTSPGLDSAKVCRALEPLQFVRLRVSMQALEPLVLPAYKGSTLHGAFGRALKDAVCIARSKECDHCIIAPSCPYSYAFETPVPTNSRRMRKYTSAPHPLVLEPPLDERSDYAPGDRLDFGLVLVGRAMEMLPFFVLAFDHMGRYCGLGKKRGRLRLAEIYCVPAGQSKAGPSTIFVQGDEQLRGDCVPATVVDLMKPGWGDAGTEVERITVCFQTPCRLMRGAGYTDRPDFHVLLRALLRRLSSLAYFHCGSDLALDFRALAVAAEHVRLVRDDTSWFDWERYSSRQNSRTRMGGVVGKAVYEGDLTSLVPLLRLGEVMHVGKGTSFGLGKYGVAYGVETEGE